MKTINKFTKIILVIALLLSQLGESFLVFADEITSKDLNMSLDIVMGGNNDVDHYTFKYSSLHKNYVETENVGGIDVDKKYDIVLTSSFTYLDDTKSADVINNISNVTGKTLNTTESSYDLGPISSKYNGTFSLNVKVMDGTTILFEDNMEKKVTEIENGLIGKLNDTISSTTDGDKITFNVATATSYQNVMYVKAGDLNPNSTYIVVYPDETESAEMTAEELLTYKINGTSVDLTGKLSGEYPITDNITLKEKKAGVEVNTYPYTFDAVINYGNASDNDTLFSSMYTLLFKDGNLVLNAKNLYDPNEIIATVGDMVTGLTDSAITLKITDSDGNDLDLTDAEVLAKELQNGYKITFTNGTDAEYEVLVMGDATSDNNFDKADVQKAVDSYLANEKLSSMDFVIPVTPEEEKGTITFDDVNFVNNTINKNPAVSDNTKLSLGFGGVPSEVYVGDETEITILVNSEDLEEYITGIDGNLVLSDNIELTNIKVGDNQIGGYKDKHFTVISPNVKNGEVMVTLVFNPTKEGMASISLSGNISKDTYVNDLGSLVANFNVIRKISNNSYLDSLNADVGTFDKTFDRDVLSYTLTVPYNTTTVILSGALADIYSSVTGLTQYTLEGNTTTATITVTAEDGTTRVYTINIVREAATPIAYYPSGDNFLDELTIEGYEIDFSRYTTEYKINVENTINSLDIRAIASDNRSTVLITGNENFKVGENIVTIRVTAENGDAREYKIIVNKKEKANVTPLDEVEGGTPAEKVVIVGLIAAVVFGLLYLIFKKDEAEIVVEQLKK